MDHSHLGADILIGLGPVDHMFAQADRADRVLS
jgi:hypothetical protein